MTDLGNVLERFGLTEYEAKTLTTLFKLSEAEAPDISRHAQVPKTRVYDVLEKLMAKKLVIEVNGRPKKYKVTSATETFSQLVSAKKAELAQLESEALALQETLSATADSGELGERVLKVKDKNDFLKIVGHEIAKAKSEIVCFSNLGNKLGALSEQLKSAAQKNVDVRILHDAGETAVLQDELSKQGLNVKNADHGLNAMVIDNEKVIMFLSDISAEKPEYHFTIWPRNAAMAGMLKHYFAHHWEKQEQK
jgi:sugar-specific transcriptional regulator TrmB